MTTPTSTPDPFNLTRFTTAQAPAYFHALRAIRSGKKTTHWMWFIFPQLSSLATSSMSAKYAITSLPEARAYLAHPILGPRLVEISTAVLESRTTTALELMGVPDDVKLWACMTLFKYADREGRFEWQAVLDKYWEGREHVETGFLLEVYREGRVPA